MKFVEKINAVQETDNLDDMEFHDTVGFQSSSILNGSHSRLIKGHPMSVRYEIS